MARLEHLTVARRYATALLQLAKDRGVVDAVAVDLAELKGAIDADPSILAKLADPKARGVEKRRLVEERLASGRHELVKNLLSVLVQRRREVILADFFFAFGEELEKASGVLRVEVETAKEADPAFLKNLSDRLAAATSRPVTLEARVRPELLGGLRLVAESKMVDAAVSSKLDRLKRKLLSARA
ncbi:MAG TPA: ATP synthase F1 subunit delta [Planctomycetota bacterium]|nr:ATP synthase F1 subunit delta [Planctomycetota bacterium]